jgi:tRNA 2-selenouridine synthase
MKQALSVHAGECFAQTWSGEAPHCWSYDYIIDTRSPAEYRLDRLPGAVNWPVLDDRQRETIGTMYQREGAFKAKREGAILVARNIASLIERHARSIDKEARLLIYCWRGGNRSGSLSTVLSRIGFRCDVLDGGYKAFRRWVMEDSARRVSQLHFQIIAGRTGSGKTDLLHHLAAQGAQVIDLEGLAKHRGSLLGAQPEQIQPSQRLFETELWFRLGQCEPDKAVWLESESRKIGQIQIPESMIEKMRASDHYQLEVDATLRTQYLLKHYQYWTDHPQDLEHRLLKLKTFMAAETFAMLVQCLKEGRMQDFVDQLLKKYYDPLYDRSIAKNYRVRKNAVKLDRLDQESMAALAKSLCQEIVTAKA